jgi:hypothetical protein
LVGGTLFGVIGTLIAISVTAALAVLLEEIQHMVGTSGTNRNVEVTEGALPSPDLDGTKVRDGE